MADQDDQQKQSEGPALMYEMMGPEYFANILNMLERFEQTKREDPNKPGEFLTSTNIGVMMGRAQLQLLLDIRTMLFTALAQMGALQPGGLVAAKALPGGAIDLSGYRK